MGDASTVIAIVVAGILGGIGTWFSRRKLREAGILSTRAETVQTLRDNADAWEQRANLEVAARVSAEQALADLKAEQKLERIVAGQNRSDLADARDRIRELERRRDPRSPRG